MLLLAALPRPQNIWAVAQKLESDAQSPEIGPGAMRERLLPHVGGP